MELTDVLPAEAIVEPQGRYLADLMGRGVQGTADAVVLPSTAEEVAAVMRWCYDNDVPLTIALTTPGAIWRSITAWLRTYDRPRGRRVA